MTDWNALAGFAGGVDNFFKGYVEESHRLEADKRAREAEDRQERALKLNEKFQELGLQMKEKEFAFQQQRFWMDQENEKADRELAAKELERKLAEGRRKEKERAITLKKAVADLNISQQKFANMQEEKEQESKIGSVRSDIIKLITTGLDEYGNTYKDGDRASYSTWIAQQVVPKVTDIFNKSGIKKSPAEYVGDIMDDLGLQGKDMFPASSKTTSDGKTILDKLGVTQAEWRQNVTAAVTGRSRDIGNLKNIDQAANSQFNAITGNVLIGSGKNDDTFNSMRLFAIRSWKKVEINKYVDPNGKYLLRYIRPLLKQQGISEDDIKELVGDSFEFDKPEPMSFDLKKKFSNGVAKVFDQIIGNNKLSAVAVFNQIQRGTFSLYESAESSEEKAIIISMLAARYGNMIEIGRAGAK